jgi:predicted DNA-binding transcriptional regulator YafY
MASISTINQAIRHGNQIAFKYLSYSFDNMRTQVERRSGKVYVVNPYKLLIDNGFFYLMTYNGTKPIIFRIDRMKDVKELLTAREWEKEFRENVDVDNYTKRVFSMFGGKRERVTMRFRIEKLDTVVDQFGIAGAKYEKVDESHFTVTTEVELSEMFYAWIFGFGRRAKIMDPPYVADKMREYCQKIAEMYEPK